MDKYCIACGMPMKTSSDFAMNDSNKKYCKFCCNEDGGMQSYETKLESMTQFIIKTKHKDKDSAKQLAEEIMSKLPAWNN